MSLFFPLGGWKKGTQTCLSNLSIWRKLSDSLIDHRNSLRLRIEAVMNLLWIDTKDMQFLPDQAACSIAVKCRCSSASQFCRLLQCFAYPWLGCCVCSFISICVWAMIFLCWSTCRTCQVGFHFAQQFAVGLFEISRAFHVQKIPWIQISAVFGVEMALSWKLSTFQPQLNVQEGSVFSK